VTRIFDTSSLADSHHSLIDVEMTQMNSEVNRGDRSDLNAAGSYYLFEYWQPSTLSVF
jgi:hypothetical protein